MYDLNGKKEREVERNKYKCSIIFLMLILLAGEKKRKREKEKKIRHVKISKISTPGNVWCVLYVVCYSRCLYLLVDEEAW